MQARSAYVDQLLRATPLLHRRFCPVRLALEAGEISREDAECGCLGCVEMLIARRLVTELECQHWFRTHPDETATAFYRLD